MAKRSEVGRVQFRREVLQYAAQANSNISQSDSKPFKT